MASAYTEKEWRMKSDHGLYALIGLISTDLGQKLKKEHPTLALAAVEGSHVNQTVSSPSKSHCSQSLRSEVCYFWGKYLIVMH